MSGVHLSKRVGRVEVTPEDGRLLQNLLISLIQERNFSYG